MSLSSMLCKIFSFVLKVFKKIVQAVAEAIKVVGTAVIDVLDTLLEGASNALFGGNLFAKIALIGVGYFLITRSQDKRDSQSRGG